MLRIFEAGFSKNLKNTEPRPKFSYSYKKKACNETTYSEPSQKSHDNSFTSKKDCSLILVDIKIYLPPYKPCDMNKSK